jgi:hypothetical protein
MDLSQQIPSYLTEKRNILRLIFFTAGFALIFINIYSPFDISLWFKVTRLQLLFYSSLVILTGVLVVVVSRIILYHVVKRKIKVSIGNYLIWIAAEVLSMALFYVFYEIYYLKDARTFWDLYKLSIQNTALVLLLPYSISWLYFSWKDKNQQLERLSYSVAGVAEPKEMLPFKDEKGVMRISIKTSDLLFLQAADNYVTIFYIHQQKLAKYMLRTSLKQIETELGYSPFIRCHRSYMVNFEKVKIIRREKDGLKLLLEAPDLMEIPVSKTYMEEVFKAFGQDL